MSTKKNINKNEIPNFETLYTQLRDQIYYYIKKRVGSAEDAEDISAEVFVKVYKKLPDFKWQGVQIKTWIYTIARNAIIDHHRKGNSTKDNTSLEASEIQIEDPSLDRELLVSLLSDEEQKQLYLGLSKLKPEDQFLIYFKYFEELSNSEIAERLEMSETNVGTRLYRLRKKLLQIINNEKNNPISKK